VTVLMNCVVELSHRKEPATVVVTFARKPVFLPPRMNAYGVG